MTSSGSTPTSLSPAKIPLLREAIEVLIGELSALSEPSVTDLSELKKKKVVLASRLGQLEGEPGAVELEAFDLMALKALVVELEAQSRQKIQGHLDFIGHQVLALQDEHQYWRECLNVSFGKFCAPIPTP